MNPDLPNVLAELLQATFKGSDNSVLRETQVRLKALYAETPHFFEAFSEILQSLQSFSDSIDYPFHEISVRLATKIEDETKKVLSRLNTGASNKEIELTVIIKCYNCLKTLLEHENLPREHLVNSKQASVEQQVAKLAPFLNEPKHAILDVELLKTRRD